jgi:hypothetical protein
VPSNLVLPLFPAIDKLLFDCHNVPWTTRYDRKEIKMKLRPFGLWIAPVLLWAFTMLPAAAHSHSHSRFIRHSGGGMTYCTYYRDRLGRTASDLVPRGAWVLLSRGGTAIRVRITDRGVHHFDLTPGQFRRFAPLHQGVVSHVHYQILRR